MKRYQVFYETNTDESTVAEFDTIEQAVAYMKEQTEGKEFAGVGYPYEDSHKAFRYATYDEETFTEECGYGDPIADTNYYWE